MDIINYKLKSFLKKSRKLIEEYVLVLKYVRPKETNNEIIHMKLKDVEFFKKNIYSNSDKALIKIISMVQNIPEKKVFDYKIVDFFGYVNSVKSQLEVISRAEENSLTSEPNVKWELVNGAEEMAKFGIYNTLENLSNGNALEYEKYEEMKYSKIFVILHMRNTMNALQRQMEKIKLKNE